MDSPTPPSSKAARIAAALDRLWEFLCKYPVVIELIAFTSWGMVLHSLLFPCKVCT